MATMDYETENGRYNGESISGHLLQQALRKMISHINNDHADEPAYERDRSASPRPKRDDDYQPKREDSYRDRSASPNGRVDSRYVYLDDHCDIGGIG